MDRLSLNGLFELTALCRRLVAELANEPIDRSQRPARIQHCLPIAAAILAADGEETLWQVAEKMRPDYGHAIALLPLTLTLAGASPQPCPGREMTHRLHPVMLPVSIALPPTTAQGEVGAPPARLWEAPELRSMVLEGDRRAWVDPHLYTAPFLWNKVSARSWYAYTTQLDGHLREKKPLSPLGAPSWTPGLDMERADRSRPFEEEYLVLALIEAPLGSFPYSVAPIAFADLLAQPLQRLRPGATLEVLMEKVVLPTWTKETALEMVLKHSVEPMVQGCSRMIGATPKAMVWLGMTSIKPLLCIELRHPENGAGVAEFHMGLSARNLPLAEVEAAGQRVLRSLGIKMADEEDGHE